MSSGGGWTGSPSEVDDVDVVVAVVGWSSLGVGGSITCEWECSNSNAAESSLVTSSGGPRGAAVSWRFIPSAYSAARSKMRATVALAVATTTGAIGSEPFVGGAAVFVPAAVEVGCGERSPDADAPQPIGRSLVGR